MSWHLAKLNNIHLYHDSPHDSNFVITCFLTHFSIVMIMLSLTYINCPFHTFLINCHVFHVSWVKIGRFFFDIF
jgi:hypothetical protein